MSLPYPAPVCCELIAALRRSRPGDLVAVAGDASLT
jgi:hypothetical protein